MARMRGQVDDRGYQIKQSRVIARTLGTWTAARYLFRRHWHIESTLFILLGIRSERKLTPFVDEIDLKAIPTLGLEYEIKSRGEA